MKVCPVCGKEDSLRLSDTKGFWEEKAYPLVLLRPFKCSKCRSRFYRFSWKNGRSHRGRKKRAATDDGAFSTLKQPSQQEFEKLIEEIHEAEKVRFENPPRTTGHFDSVARVSDVPEDI